MLAVGVLLPCVSSGTLAVPSNPEQPLPRRFPSGPAAVDGVASISRELVLATGGECSSSVVREGADLSEKCTDPWVGAEECGGIYLSVVLDEGALLLSVYVDLHAT